MNHRNISTWKLDIFARDQKPQKVRRIHLGARDLCMRPRVRLVVPPELALPQSRRKADTNRHPLQTHCNLEQLENLQCL